MVENMTVTTDIRRVRFIVEGTVQGVGFRPFVYHLAQLTKLNGFVRNDGQGVIIEVEGPYHFIQTFRSKLVTDLPGLATITRIREENCDIHHVTSFAIQDSTQGIRRALTIPPDVALCPECRNELFDPSNRRFGYPFNACTQCGPRFTVIETLPYDRMATTMVDFPLCENCDEEYRDPGSRRFHAEATGCLSCGPTLELLTDDESFTGPVLDQVSRLLAQGDIVGIKGIGGYHLACAAWNDESIERLRQIKARPSKPFALMARDVDTIRKFCVVTPEEEALLSSPVAPIVLLAHRRDDSLLSDLIAPGLMKVGVMLPYAPLHALILEQLKAEGYPPIVVMTSANHHGEPVIFEDQTMGSFVHQVDGILRHNRRIEIPVDDSVVQVADNGRPLILRRARGFVPSPIKLPTSVPISTLALGSHMKSTFCLTEGDEAILSPHIGDLDTTLVQDRYRYVLAHMLALGDIEPATIAVDFHPQYASSHVASAWPDAEIIKVQHHHAHIAAVMGEHVITDRAVGLALDGTGLGDDGAIWGGEILVARLTDFQRACHVRYVPLVGGDRAIREPWRIAATYLQLIFGDAWLQFPLEFVRAVPLKSWRLVKQLLEQNVHNHPTSSTGRLFDAAAALITGRIAVDYEAQAAMELEQLAREDVEPYALPVMASPLQTGIIDPFPLIRAVMTDLLHHEDQRIIAGRFHKTLAWMFADAAADVAEKQRIAHVVAAGGVMQNRVFVKALRNRLAARGYDLKVNEKVPPNDGGLSYGQAVVAQAILAARATQNPKIGKEYQPCV